MAAIASELDDGYSSITGETLDKAIKELKEDPNTRGDLVRELRDKILCKEREMKVGGADSAEFERKDGKFLLRFLRARKFNLDKSLQLYTNYYKYKHKFRHLLTDFHPKHAKNVLNAGIFGVLDSSTMDKCKVVCVIPQRWSYQTVPSNDPYKTFLMMLEKLVEDEEVQVHGICILDNMEGMSWHLGYAFLRSEQLPALVELQDAFPIRFKGFHMFNQPWYLSMIMAVVKPFLSQKHRDRIQAHGDDYTALSDYMDMSQLPETFGGQAPALEADNLRNFFESDMLDIRSISSQTWSFHSGRE